MTNRELVKMLVEGRVRFIENIPEGYNNIRAFISDYGAGFVASHLMKPPLIFENNEWVEIKFLTVDSGEYEQGRTVLTSDLGGMATHVQGKDLVAEVRADLERVMELKEEREERASNPSSKEGRRLKRSDKPF